MSRVVDPEGAHLAALRRLVDFRGRQVIELGCGDGRLTVPIARDAARVIAFDPDAEAVERARRSLSADLARASSIALHPVRGSRFSGARSTSRFSPGRSDESNPRTS